MDTPPPPPSHAARAAAFAADLASATGSIDMANLRALARGGLPDSPPSARAAAWKLLLGYLPADTAAWERVLASKRGEYAQFVDDFAAPAAAPAHAATEDDHPLSSAPDSAWATHFQATTKDAELVAQIARDVERTHPDLAFFAGAGVRHALARVLLVFAKTNPALAYVQGMNELLAPIYYVFASADKEEVGGGGKRCGGDASATPSPHSPPEADAFWCLVALMADFRDNFCAALDDSSGGVRAALAALASTLRAADPRVAAHLFNTNAVDPAFFGFRWTTLLLTQEFALPDAVVLWDGLLAEAARDRAAALRRVCAAMVISQRAALLAGDFAANVKLLQSFPPQTDVRALLAGASALKSVDAAAQQQQ